MTADFPINIWNQVPQSYADLLRPDSQLNSPATNTVGEIISYSHPRLYFPDFYLLTILLCTFSAVFTLSFSARLPQLPTELTYIPLEQFILRGVRSSHFYGCVQFVSTPLHNVASSFSISRNRFGS